MSALPLESEDPINVAVVPVRRGFRRTGGLPVVVCAAITGSLPQKSDNPAVPITTAEQIACACECYDAGARLLHLHVRDEAGRPSSDPARFAAVRDGVQAARPGMVVQFSTGGRGRDPAQRGSALGLRPDMASLSTGSTNFPASVYENPTDLVEELARSMREHGVVPEVEIFDLGHLHAAHRLVGQGLLGVCPHVQFVLGVRNALPADERLLDVLLAEMDRVLPGATWTAAGIGRFQAPVMEWALMRGADAVRTGLEDNVRMSRGVLARGNAELVEAACAMVRAYGRRPADCGEARALLGLPPYALPSGAAQHADLVQEAVFAQEIASGRAGASRSHVP